MTFDNSVFRKKLKDLGYKSENDFFDRTNTAKSTFQNVKIGKCDLVTAIRICKLLDCELSELFPSSNFSNYMFKSFKTIAIASPNANMGISSLSVDIALKLSSEGLKVMILEYGQTRLIDIISNFRKLIIETEGYYSDNNYSISKFDDNFYCLSIEDANDFRKVNGFESASELIKKLSLISNEDLTNFLIKLNAIYRIDYFIFSCSGMNRSSVLNSSKKYIERSENFLKISDKVLIGFNTHLVDLESIKGLLKWMPINGQDIYLFETMRFTSEFFKNSEVKSNYFSSREIYLKNLEELISVRENLHLLNTSIDYFRVHEKYHSTKYNLLKFYNNKNKLDLNNYKDQISSLINELK